VTLCNLDTLVPEQYAYSFEGHAGQQQLDGKSVPKTMRVPVGYSCKPEQFAETPLPVPYGALWL